MDTCRETLSVAEAGRILGICRNSAYRLAREGIIPNLRLGRKVVVPRAALEQLLKNPQGLAPMGGPRGDGGDGP